MKVKPVKEGKCALTGNEGKFVKCHIIPQALTRPSSKGEPLWQGSKGTGPKKRWSSWYDPNLVVRSGEDVLGVIDDKAIRVMREHMLIWSSWVVFKPSFEKIALSLPEHSYRIVRLGTAAADLHMFALSILWRAAASSMPDMSEVTLEPEVLEKLRNILLADNPLDFRSFPTAVVQISTVGEKQNHSPYLDEWNSPEIDGVPAKTSNMARIFVDGLIFHIHLNGWEDSELENNPMFLGSSDKVLMTAVSYEASFQFDNFLTLMHETFLGPLKL